MKKISKVFRVSFLVGLVIILPVSVLFAKDVGERVVKRGTIGDDIYLAGGEVDVDAKVNGDITVAGGELYLAGDVRGDVNAAGGSLTLRSHVADDVRLAGGEVTVLGSVGDDVIAAGGRVRLDRDAKIGGRAWLSGGDIRVAGAIRQELRASGGRVTLTGKVGGDVFLWSEKIEIGSEAVIMGNLHTKGPQEAYIAEGARIHGDVKHETADVSIAPVIAGIVGVALLFLLSMIVAGIVLYLLFPRYVERTAQSLRETPWQSLGIGLAVFAATPIVILVLLLTAVGIWLALLLLLAYLIMLMLGYLMGAFFVGEAGLRLTGKKDPTKRSRVIALAVAILVLAIVGLIPLLGSLIGWLVLLVGLGALLRQMYFSYKGASA